MIRHYPDHPIVGIGIVVFKANRVLLIRRSKPPREGGWSLPGGAQELGETVYEAGRREVREETGLEVTIVDVVAVVDSITRDGKGAVEYHYTLVDILAEWRAGEARPGSDAAEIVWADPDVLEPYDLWRETVRVIGLARARRERP